MPVVRNSFDGDVSVWCVLVAAGSGRRYGGAKQFESVGGRRVLDRSLDAALAHCDGVVLVVAPDAVERERRLAEAGLADDAGAPTAVVAGGATRSESVRCGLAAVPDAAGVIVVHDAARPLATPELFSQVVGVVLDGASAGVPVIPVVDTIRRSDGAVVDRNELRAVQTPQAFAAEILRSVHAASPEATDDASLVEAAGGTVSLIPGEVRNVKLTTQEDRLIIEAFLAVDNSTAAPSTAAVVIDESSLAGPEREDS